MKFKAETNFKPSATPYSDLGHHLGVLICMFGAMSFLFSLPDELEKFYSIIVDTFATGLLIIFISSICKYFSRSG
jgi:hypothetical protein